MDETGRLVAGMAAVGVMVFVGLIVVTAAVFAVADEVKSLRAWLKDRDP